jgi:small-conductance mechanosensitive channel
MLSTQRSQPPPHRPQSERRAAWATVAAALIALAALFAVRSELLQLVPKNDRLISQLGIFIVAVVLGGLAVRAIISRVFTHLRGTQLYAWRPAATWCLYLILGAAVLSALQINITGLLAAGAIVGVVVGVAAQTSLGSVFAGLVLLIARPFVVGNWVHVRSSLFGPIEYAGVVTHIGVVYTTLDVTGRPVRIPNSTVLGAALTVTHIPLQVDIEVQLRPETSLVQLSHRLERKLELTPGENVELRPVRLEAAPAGSLICQLQIRSHRPIDLTRVSRVVLEGEAAKEGAGPAAAS